MKLKHIALAAAMAVSVGSASAANQTIDFSSGSASFAGTPTILDGGDDVITFTNLAAGTYNFLLSLSSQNISNLAASLNGQSATIDSFGKFSFGYLESTGTSPFALTLTGLTKPGSLYSVDFSAALVPEPGTYALLFAGLGVIGFVARRRRPRQ